MSMSIDDIWNTPLDATPPRTRKDVLAGEANSNTPARPSPAKRRRTTLFLSSDSENENDAPTASTSKTPAQTTAGDKQKALIDSLFDDLDGDDFVDDGGFKELAPAPSIDELRRQAQASQRNRTRIPPSTPYEILPSSSPERDLGPGGDGGVGGNGERGGKGRKGEGEEGLKKRKPVPKLDETRLVGESGFPALIKQTKDFKPRGKGHELADLNRVLGIYQFWTHKLYPKGTFHDNVQRIERLCHSKRMHNHLGMWRDASKGLINGRRPEDLEPLQDPDSDSDSDADQEPSNIPAHTNEATRSSSPPTRPPSSASSAPLPNDDVDDFDIDEMIREDEERQRQLAQSSSASSSRPIQSTSNSAPIRPQAAEPDEDQEMWDALDAGEEEVAVQDQQGEARAGGGGDDVEDEDMWDLVREIEESGGGAASAGAPVAASAPAGPAATSAGSAPAGAATTTATVAGAAISSSTGQAPTPTSPKKPATNDEGWDEMYL